MDSDGADAQKIRDAGWRQGSILPCNMLRALIEDNGLGAIDGSASSDWWMVVSQDCDVVNRDFDKEPFVEIIRIQETNDPGGGDQWGKNPRRLRFGDRVGETEREFQVVVHDRIRIDRRVLAEYAPDPERNITIENTRCICRWISQRYVRPAFPDAFNERVEGAIPALRRCLKKKGKLLTGILIWVDESELGSEEKYRVIIWATMKVEKWNDPAIRATARGLVNQICAQIRECEGIDVTECELKSEQDVSINHMRQFKRWDFDDLTIRGDGLDELLPDVF